MNKFVEIVERLNGLKVEWLFTKADVCEISQTSANLIT